jgi:hypothetical protein
LQGSSNCSIALPFAPGAACCFCLVTLSLPERAPTATAGRTFRDPERARACPILNRAFGDARLFICFGLLRPFTKKRGDVRAASGSGLQRAPLGPCIRYLLRAHSWREDNSEVIVGWKLESGSGGAGVVEMPRQHIPFREERGMRLMEHVWNRVPSHCLVASQPDSR